ncbi:ThiF family adenylyltransferase [Bradyrhizobium sp. 147]|uniref:ThiF family adenylyltransferase n=1 Tax=Bradyrhizobium sp. 147 TaxID=2782623 RepID=UPI001FF71C93|nr:ThiF family adenylyltransferase [Bradyrhizobium sp. 147]MCK1682189.1 ThiF family adenylyltransferase [Bradyrhizobium sp. 147]
MTPASTTVNRHLLKVDGLAEEPVHSAQCVRIVVDERWAASRSGQLLASCLLNLLSRQTELVGTIQIIAPQIKSLIALPNGEAAGDFPACLECIASWAIKRPATIVILDATTTTMPEADATVMIGSNVSARSGIALFAVGDGWKAWVGSPDKAPLNLIPDKANPLGPFLAAALAAGEIFKRFRGLLRGRFLDCDGYSLWSGKVSSDWDELEDGPELMGARLRPIHVVGAGAVGNGLAYVLANAQLAEAFSLFIDDDTYDDTSLNRCFLAGWQDVEHSKVEAVVATLIKSGVGAYAFPGTIKQYLNADRSTLPSDVARQADDLAFEIVVSCVDRGTSRQDLQGLAPTLLFGGSTLGLGARANFYPNRSGAACLSCFNPAEREGERLRDLEKKLRGMDKTDRLAFLCSEGIDPAIVEEYLSAPRCGTVGEAALRQLASRTVAEFSVGFVSLGAALLLAAKLFQQLLFASPAKRGDVTSLNFKNGGYSDSFLAPDDNCEWGCQRRRRG